MYVFKQLSSSCLAFASFVFPHSFRFPPAAAAYNTRTDSAPAQVSLTAKFSVED
jgi:hypothetical protein